MPIPEHVILSEFGYDHEGRPGESDDQIEIRIRAISPELSPVKKATAIESLFPTLSTLSDMRVNAYLQLMQKHLSLTQRELSDLRRSLKDHTKDKKDVNKATPPTQAELITRLKQEEERRTISPAQDYRDETLYLTVKIAGQPHLLTSEREIFSFSDAEGHSLVLENADVEASSFSPAGTVKYLNGGHNIRVDEIFDQIQAYVRQYVVLQDKRYYAFLALWVIGTYMFKVFDYYPYVWLNAEKGSGKSLLMKVLSGIAFNGEILISPTEAVIFRDVANDCCSLFIDEVEKLRKQDKDVHGALISLLNSGFERGGFVKRVEKSLKGGWTRRKYPAYSPKMFAGINDLDEVLLDRTILIKLLRKKEDEQVERFRLSDQTRQRQQQIRDDCSILALESAADLAQRYYDLDNDIPGLDHLANRERDIWEPILLLAGHVDGFRGSTDLVATMTSLSADSMALKQRTSVEENETFKLLKVLHEMVNSISPLSDAGGQKLAFTTDQVLKYFCETDEYGWMDERKKGSLTKRLKKVEVETGQQKLDGKNVRTYIIDVAVLNDMCERFKIA